MVNAIDWPNNPSVGDKFTISEGVIYEWQADGYWKGDSTVAETTDSDSLCFMVKTPPANSSEVIYEIILDTGQTVNLEAIYSFGQFNVPPATDQLYEVYVDEVKASDDITVLSAGGVNVSLPRSPYIGPMQLRFRVSSGTTIDNLYDGCSLVSPIV